MCNTVEQQSSLHLAFFRENEPNSSLPQRRLMDLVLYNDVLEDVLHAIYSVSDSNVSPGNDLRGFHF